MTDARQLVNKNTRPKAVESTLEGKTTREFKIVMILVALHIPLGIILFNIGFLGLLHPAVIFLIGLGWAFNRKIGIERILLAVAYIIGSEVLWRMAQLPTFWEFGKYASAAIMIVALVRRGFVRIPTLPLVYFALLLPGCVLTLVSYDLSDAREQISFNLSGPFLLLISCWLFSYIKLNQWQIRRLFLALIIPLISVAFATLFFTVSNPDIHFSTESNFATSGGFGPNQVSSMLGLGAFAAVACFVLFKNSSKYSLFFAVVALLMTTQSVMTFSRGGMYNAIGALTIVVLFQTQNIVTALKRFVPIAIVAGAFLLVIFPILNNFTGGKLQERFEETEMTGRSEIIESDFEILAENPILGVGVGVAQTYRGKFLDHAAASHTEFSRLMSDHGLLGILAIFCLILMFLFNIRRQNSSFGRALVGGLIMWSSLYMMNAGMRLAAPALIWGMSFITINRLFGRKKGRQIYKRI